MSSFIVERTCCLLVESIIIQYTETQSTISNHAKQAELLPKHEYANQKDDDEERNKFHRWRHMTLHHYPAKNATGKAKIIASATVLFFSIASEESG